jgi:hypothetical protein
MRVCVFLVFGIIVLVPPEIMRQVSNEAEGMWKEAVMG